jgi:hypothetical protein
MTVPYSATSVTTGKHVSIPADYMCRDMTCQIERGDVRFVVFMAMTMKDGVFWDVTPCGSCKNQRFGGTYRLHHQGDKNR